MIDRDITSSRTLDNPVRIADRLWWVGQMDPDDDYQNHVYLLENGDESVVFDPGSRLHWPKVRAKIEQVTSLSSIKWIVCHHPDPDISSALRPLALAVGRDDLKVVTHWRTWSLLRHLDLPCDIWDVEEHDWSLELGDRRLEFVFTPYLHYAGAFATFDRSTGTLLSGDLCSGFSDETELFMADMEELDRIEAYHQHYMPAREILMAAILELEALPVTRIAPQHGRVITEEFVSLVFSRLKTLECGLFLLQTGGMGFSQLQLYNRILKETMDTLANEQDFSAVAKQFTAGLQQVLPVTSLIFVVPWEDGAWLKLSPENMFHGEIVREIPCGEIFAGGGDGWRKTFGSDCTIATTAMARDRGLSVQDLGPSLLTRLESMVDDSQDTLLVIGTDHDHVVTDDLRTVMDRLATPLSVALDRELVRRRLESERDQIFERSIRDPLTGLYTRRYMDDVVTRLVGASERESIPGMALLMFDVDHFKRVNDTWGHPVGDEVLRMLAGVMLKASRDSDIPVRYGGEEFAFFLITDQEDVAVKAAERIRNVLSNNVFEIEGDEFHVTASVGIALHKHGSDLSDLIRRADKALYQAKETGRDKVCVYREAEKPVEIGQV